MSLAERTRAAARDHPFLVDALRAGVANYSAAARTLDVDGDADAVATALRRYADDLPDRDPASRDVRVRMRRGVGRIEDGTADALLAVAGAAFGETDDGRTAVLATGDVDLHAARAALDALAVADVAVDAAAFDADALVVVVDARAAADALRAVEAALDAVPTPPTGDPA